MTGEITVEQFSDCSSFKTDSNYYNECMTQVMDQVKKTAGKCTNFHHLTLWVSNAKQCAMYFCVCFGFEQIAYSGLETGDRQYATHVVRQNRIIIAFVSPLTADEKIVNEHLVKHGDAVHDIAFEVDNLEVLLEHSKSKGGQILKDIWTSKDENGEVKMAIIKAFGDTTHTLIERNNYKGEFLPGFTKPMHQIKLLESLPKLNLEFIDHCVAAQIDDEMKSTADWYQENLNFHRFWSVDDAINIVTEFSALKFIVVANEDESIKLNILEAAEGKKKSQVHEFLEYYDGPGIQHIAFHTNDIIQAIRSLEMRGVEFLKTPNAYYDKLKERLKQSKVTIQEDLDELQKYKILLDFDDNGYLLQIFTKPLQDRPTVFIEIIQRHNHFGFGAGNFSALFEAVEMEQALRGNLN